MGRRITRKQLKKDDEFVSAAEIIFRWIADNYRALLAGIGAVCLVALAWWGASLWSGARADDASMALRDAVMVFEGEVPSPTGQPTGDVAAAEAKFREVIEDYGRFDQADMARLYLSRISLDRGDVDAAKASLIEVADRQGDSFIGRLAQFDLIDLKIAAGQGAEVVAELEAVVAGSSTAVPRDYAVYKLGEYYRNDGQPDIARGYYERLVEDFPQSAYQGSVQQRLNELG